MSKGKCEWRQVMNKNMNMEIEIVESHLNAKLFYLLTLKSEI